MTLTWITLYPQWYAEERRRIYRHYPEFKLHRPALDKGILLYFGELMVRPTGGIVKHPISLLYPHSTPFQFPVVTPLVSLPDIDDDGLIRKMPKVKMFDERHQMSNGSLCLFQRETRAVPGGDIIRGIDALRRAQQWFLGYHTGHWPPDSAEAELEEHFHYITDILLSEIFFSPEIAGKGKFYMIPDLRRLVDGDRRELPLIVTALTEETNMYKVFDARNEISRLYPWIQSEAWDPEKIPELNINKSNSIPPMLKGYWWSLSEEPKPFHNGIGLLREIAKSATDQDPWHLVESQIGSELSLSDQHYLGFRYPGRHGNYEWLMLYMNRGNRKDRLIAKTSEIKRREFEKSAVYCLRTHTIRPVELRLRNTSVVDKGIQNKTVAMIGLGALGSTVTELLAKAGVGKFRICDSDTLSTGNVARHIGGLNEFGDPKTWVVMRRLLEINPNLNFSDGDIISGSAIGSLDGLADFISSADLIISTTADESVESAINEVAVILQKPVIYGRSLRRGSIGRTFIVRPGKDACKECISEYARQGRLGNEVPSDWIEVTESEDDILLHECGRPVIPASAIDLTFISAQIARIALDYLEGKLGESNHWLWSRLPDTETDYRLDRNMCTVEGRLEPIFGCPACQEPDVVRIIMNKVVHRNIIEISEASLNEETCGILIGYVNDKNQAIALRATGPGPKAIRSQTECSRDVEYVQAELDRAVDELGAQGQYIGEWHSHLEINPQPSFTDIDSLLGIAIAPNYLTRCPVMVIVGIDPSTHKVHQTKAYSFPVGGRMYATEIDYEDN